MHVTNTDKGSEQGKPPWSLGVQHTEAKEEGLK